MDNNKYVTYDELKEITDEISHVVARLLDALQIRGTITPDDRKYIAGQLDKDTWYKDATRSPFDIFMDMLKEVDTKKPDMPTDMDQGES